MTAPNHNSLCEQAEIYYYDFLFNKCDELVPEALIKHIEHCSHCQEQINQLKVTLSPHGAAKSEDSQVSGTSSIPTFLKLHFAYVGKKVTCKTARAFLPAFFPKVLFHL